MVAEAQGRKEAKQNLNSLALSTCILVQVSAFLPT